MPLLKSKKKSVNKKLIRKSNKKIRKNKKNYKKMSGGGDW